MTAHPAPAALLAEIDGFLKRYPHSPSRRILEACRAALAERIPRERDAVEEIAAERRRQVEGEGWTPEHDDEHADGELARAAACYALGKETVTNIGGERVGIWPYETWNWKPKDTRRNLIRAGALIVAEIERLDRAIAGDSHG